MAFDSTPQSTEYSASSYALDSIDNAISRDEYDPSSSDDISSLRLQASRLEHLLQVMPAGVIVIDGKGIVRQANEQAKALLGEPLEEEVWRSIITRSFKPRADCFSRLFVPLFPSGRFSSSELLFHFQNKMTNRRTCSSAG